MINRPPDTEFNTMKRPFIQRRTMGTNSKRDVAYLIISFIHQSTPYVVLHRSHLTAIDEKVLSFRAGMSLLIVSWRDRGWLRFLSYRMDA